MSAVETSVLIKRNNAFSSPSGNVIIDLFFEDTITYVLKMLVGLVSTDYKSHASNKFHNSYIKNEDIKI